MEMFDLEDIKLDERWSYIKGQPIYTHLADTFLSLAVESPPYMKIGTCTKNGYPSGFVYPNGTYIFQNLLHICLDFQ